MGFETAEHWRSNLNNVISPRVVIPSPLESFKPIFDPRQNYAKLYVSMYQRNKDLLSHFDEERLAKNKLFLELLMLENAFNHQKQLQA